MISVQPETGNTNPNRLPSTHGVGKVCHPVSGFGITSGSIRPSAFSRSSSRPLSSALLKPLLIAFLLSIFLTIDMSGQPWLADYCYRKEITIDEAQVSGTSEHLSFPVLINIAGITVSGTAETVGCTGPGRTGPSCRRCNRRLRAEARPLVPTADIPGEAVGGP